MDHLENLKLLREDLEKRISQMHEVDHVTKIRPEIKPEVLAAVCKARVLVGELIPVVRDAFVRSGR
jgi:hypothetical protein